MDMDIVFASNLVVESKVVKLATQIAINTFFYIFKGNNFFFFLKVKGIPAKISDFGLRGMLRVVFKPLVKTHLSSALNDCIKF